MDQVDRLYTEEAVKKLIATAVARVRDDIIDEMRVYCEYLYCAGIKEAKNNCLGLDFKLANNLFKKEDYDAHKKMNGFFGAHYEIASLTEWIRKKHEQ